MEVIKDPGKTTAPTVCAASHKLKCMCWNINNYKSEIFKNKLEDEDFLNKIKNCDILSLVETHTAKTDILNLPGYAKPFQVNRKKFNRKYSTIF